MKKTIFVIIFSIILMFGMLLIPNRVNAETIIEFDYSKIKALNMEMAKLYDIDSSVGEILSQDWKDENGLSMLNTSMIKIFQVGKKYTYTADIKLNDPNAFINIINPPPALEGTSTSVLRISNDIIRIEIVTVIPKTYKLSVVTSEGIIIDGFTPNISKEFVVYEMEEFTLDFDLEDEYEVTSAEANGNLIFENDAYFDDTFAHIFENKLRVWNINTDVEISINAEKIKPKLKINLTSNDVYVGDTAEDVKFDIDYNGLEVSKVEIGEIIEIENGKDFKKFTGNFEANKKYIALVTLKINVALIEELEKEYSEATVYYNGMPIDLEYVSENEGLAICELTIKEKTEEINNTVNNNANNNGEKDETPKTGDNSIFFITTLGMVLIGVLIIKRRK